MRIDDYIEFFIVLYGLGLIALVLYGITYGIYKILGIDVSE